MTPTTEAEAVEFIARARAHICRAEHFDSFAFGLLLQHEQVLRGLTILPPKMLPQFFMPTPQPKDDLFAELA